MPSGSAEDEGIPGGLLSAGIDPQEGKGARAQGTRTQSEDGDLTAHESGWNIEQRTGGSAEMVIDMKRETGFGQLKTPTLVLLLFLPLFFLLVPPSLAQGFEYDGFNGTTYILAKLEAEVIVPANGTSFNLSLPYKSEIRLFDSNGSEVPVEIEVQFWRGSHQYQVVSEEEVTGHLNYTHPITDQRFVALAEVGEAVRVVLPQGYSTGDPVLGRARPSPDEIEVRDNRTVLIWSDLDKKTLIDVSFYKEDAPWAFRLFLLLLAFLAAVLVLEHHASIRKLRSFREEAEEDQAEEGRI